jgi:hypothetical protein
MELMKKISLFFALFLWLGQAKSQLDTSIFMQTNKIATNDYYFSIPEVWTPEKSDNVDFKEKKFDFTGAALPRMYKSYPLKCSFIVKEINCDSLHLATQLITNEFNVYSDKVVPQGYTFTTETFEINSKETALLFSNHMYRKSKVSNLTRYDLAIYNDKKKTLYLFTAVINYKDNTYQIEHELQLKQYVSRVFRTIHLR